MAALGPAKPGHAVNTSLYARRQPGPGQPLDRFPVALSPGCRRSRFGRPHTRLRRCRRTGGQGDKTVCRPLKRVQGQDAAVDLQRGIHGVS
jgi:hypothetical protein